MSADVGRKGCDTVVCVFKVTPQPQGAAIKTLVNIYTLTDEHFVYRYSDVYKGYFISLNIDTKSLFAGMPRAKVNVNIETVYGDKNIVGIDYNGFENFEIDTLTISGNPQTFHILDKGLVGTQLQKLKYSQGITFDFASNSIDSGYVEEVLWWNGILMWFALFSY